jgi:hypothetical protein
MMQKLHTALSVLFLSCGAEGASTLYVSTNSPNPTPHDLDDEFDRILSPDD